MPTLRFIREARQDLEELWVYIARDNPDAADKYLEEIYQKTFLHSQQPQLGQAESVSPPHHLSLPRRICPKLSISVDSSSISITP